MKLLKAEVEILELISKMEEIKAKARMNIESRDNMVKNLQRTILNIRTDVKNGKPPRPLTPVETSKYHLSQYDFMSI